MKTRKRSRQQLDQETLQKSWEKSADFKFCDHLVVDNSKKIAVSKVSLLAQRKNGELFWFEKGKQFRLGTGCVRSYCDKLRIYCDDPVTKNPHRIKFALVPSSGVGEEKVVLKSFPDDELGDDALESLLLSYTNTLSKNKRTRTKRHRLRILTENANKEVTRSEEQARMAKDSAEAAQRQASDATLHAARAVKAKVDSAPSIEAVKRSKAGADAAKVAAAKAKAAADKAEAAADKARVACTNVNDAANKPIQVATNPHLNPYPNPASVSSQNLGYALHAYAHHTHTQRTHHIHTHTGRSPRRRCFA